MPCEVTVEGHPLETGLSGTYEYIGGRSGTYESDQPVYVNKRTGRESDGYLTRDGSAEGGGHWRVMRGVYYSWSAEPSILPTVNDNGAALRWLRVQNVPDLDCSDDPRCFEENPPSSSADEPTERDKVSQSSSRPHYHRHSQHRRYRHPLVSTTYAVSLIVSWRCIRSRRGLEWSSRARMSSWTRPSTARPRS